VIVLHFYQYFLLVTMLFFDEIIKFLAFNNSIVSKDNDFLFFSKTQFDSLYFLFLFFRLFYEPIMK